MILSLLQVGMRFQGVYQGVGLLRQSFF